MTFAQYYYYKNSKLAALILPFHGSHSGLKMDKKVQYTYYLKRFKKQIIFKFFLCVETFRSPGLVGVAPFDFFSKDIIDFFTIIQVNIAASLNCTFLDFSPLCVVIKLQSICPININRPKLSCSIYTIQQFLPYTNDNNQGIYTKIW